MCVSGAFRQIEQLTDAAPDITFRDGPDVNVVRFSCTPQEIPVHLLRTAALCLGCRIARPVTADKAHMWQS